MTRRAPYLMLALAVVGIVDASYDSYAIFTDQLLWCPPPIDGCNIVAASPYARVLGVPLGYFGVAYYIGMFALAALLALGAASRAMRPGALLYAATGLAFSVYFMYIQLNFIHAFCIYCMISGLLTLALFVVALWHYRAARLDERRPLAAPA